MKLLKIYFKLIMSLNDKDFIEFSKMSDSSNDIFVIYFCKTVCSFRKKYFIICKIPIVNWFLFKRYFKQIFRKGWYNNYV